MSVIYLVRHGQSMANISNGFAGQTDYKLSELGKKQAQMTADFLQNEQIDTVLSSTLSRAYDTALPIAAPRGLAVVRRPEIIEMNFGDWEGEPVETLEKHYPGALDTWKHEMYKTVCHGGESVAECFERSKNAFCAIAREYSDRNICIVSHGVIIRCILCFLHGLSVDEIQKVAWANNASVTKILHSDGIFRIEYEGYSSHMGEFVTGVSKKIL